MFVFVAVVKRGRAPVSMSRAVSLALPEETLSDPSTSSTKLRVSVLSGQR